MQECKQGFQGLPKRAFKGQHVFKAWKQSFYMLITNPTAFVKGLPLGFLCANKLSISSLKRMDGGSMNY